MDSQLRLAQQLFYRDRADKDRAVDYALKTVRAGNLLDVAEFPSYIIELDAIIRQLTPEQITLFGITLASLIDCAFLPLSRSPLGGDTQQIDEQCRLKSLYYYPNYKVVGIRFEVYEPSYLAHDVRYVTRYDPTPQTLQVPATDENSFPEEIAFILDLNPDDINVTQVRSVRIASRLWGIQDHTFIYRPEDWIGGARWEFLAGHPAEAQLPDDTYLLCDFEHASLDWFKVCHDWTILKEQFFENMRTPSSGWLEGNSVYIPRNIEVKKLQIEPITDQALHRRLRWHRDNFLRLLTENSTNIPFIAIERAPGTNDQYRLSGEHYNPEQRAALVAIQQLNWTTVPVWLAIKPQIQPVPLPIARYY